ncbi:MAG TPA: hypothetical protein VEZ88_07465 [Steroidobacteraceae bacterium]|nr:hypothetical protein [Steroidobacteraceae bacterium]
MFTKNRKATGTVQLATVGLFSLMAAGAWAGEGCASPATTVAFMGQLEVTAPMIRLADAGSMVVEAKRVREIAQLGSMTVTAPRVSTFAERDTHNNSSGESPARNRSPRAVLVQ